MIISIARCINGVPAVSVSVRINVSNMLGYVFVLHQPDDMGCD